MEYKHLLRHISHIISDHHWSNLAKNSRCRPPTGKGWGLTLKVAKITTVWNHHLGEGSTKVQFRNVDFEESPPFFLTPFPLIKSQPPPLFIKRVGPLGPEEIDPNHFPTVSQHFRSMPTSNSQELGFGQPYDGSRPRPQHHHPRWPLPPVFSRGEKIGSRKWGNPTKKRILVDSS